MRSRVPLFGAAALLLFMASNACRNRHNEQHLAAVDSMITTTDSLVRVMDGIDMPEMLRIDSIWSLRKGIVELRMRDTLNKEEAIALGNYQRAMTGSLGRVKHEHESVQAALTLQRKQLGDLRHDVEQGVLDATMEATYLQQERLYLASIAQRVSVITASAATARREHDLAAARVDSLAKDTTARIP